MSEKQFGLILEEIEKIHSKLNNLINARAFFQSEQPPTLIGIPDVPVKKESKPKIKEQITEKIPLIPKKNVLNAKIIHETEKAYIVKREDGLVAVIAKSHLTKEYSKNDVRQNIQFKPDRAWALNKLSWEEERIFE